jgi:hypothetical protein
MLGTMMRDASSRCDQQTALGWNQTGIQLFHSRQYDESVAAFARAITVAKQETMSKVEENSVDTMPYTPDEGVLLDAAMKLQMRSLGEPISLEELNIDELHGSTSQQYVLVGAMLVLNLAIARQASCSVNQTQRKTLPDSKNEYCRDLNCQHQWNAVLRLYDCASALLDEFLHHVLKGESHPHKRVELAAMIHRSFKLQVIHNMARAYSRIENSNAQAKKLYGQLFSYVLSMKLACKDAGAGTSSFKAPILIQDFPLKRLMDSIVDGLEILSEAVTAPGA